MKNQKQLKDNWIFPTLVGKAVSEELQDALSIRGAIRRLQRRIQKIEFENGISSDMAEKILLNNYHVGMRVYRSLMANHTEKEKTVIRYRYNEQLRISANDMGRIIEVLLPNLAD